MMAANRSRRGLHLLGSLRLLHALRHRLWPWSGFSCWRWGIRTWRSLHRHQSLLHRCIQHDGLDLLAFLGCSDCLVVTHTDGAGGHAHNHITVINHDDVTGRALSTNKLHWQVAQVNDALMRDQG